ncbi:MAG: TlpA family protein disulfide reductase [Bacteroides sp.]|jgi:thiol-disulfide isomerase/thioredoxin|nr:TlpA family protein disulfide reductase [Bacteroides sp.]
MSIKKISLLMFSLFIGNIFSYGQVGDNRLSFKPEHPVAGEKVTIFYQPLPAMHSAASIKAIVYSFNYFNWETKEMDLSPDKGKWTASFDIAPNAGLLAFKFKADTLIDNNQSLSFACMISGKDGQLMPGAYAGWGLLRTNKYGYDIPGYLDLSKIEISDSAVYHWMDMEVHNRQESNIPMAYFYSRSMQEARINGTAQRIGRVKKFLLSNGSEDALIQATQIANLEQNTTLADSISNVILKKYPHGKWALRSKSMLINRERDMNKKYADILQLLQNFPKTTNFEYFLNQYNISYDTFYQTLLIIDAINKRFDHISEYVPKMTLPGVINTFYKLIEVPHARKDLPDEQLLPYAQTMVAQAEKVQGIKPYNYRFLSDKEWKNTSEDLINKNIYMPFIDILKNTNHSDEALSYARKVQKDLNYRFASLNENMAELLEHKGKDKELQTVLEKSVFTNQTSETMMNMLKALYERNHHSIEGYEAYVESLKNPVDKLALLAAVKEFKKEGLMPAWKLEDANGNVVSSEQLKGKVYILDFWASWCVPCKASFPGMKMAAEHYKNDKDVEFYFIDTQEFNSNYKTQAVNYLKTHNFSFNLLFDGKTETAKTNNELVNKIMSTYSMSGIPLKVVVDRKGNIRYISIGYKGSPSGLSEEVIEMVEQAKHDL